jgi:hypothetical protein
VIRTGKAKSLPIADSTNELSIMEDRARYRQAFLGADE